MSGSELLSKYNQHSGGQSIGKHLYLDSAEASSKYPARKAISFHPLHIKGLMVLC